MSHNLPLIRSIDALLPQTQCGKCGHNGCKPYAEGIASGEAINKCPPGGDETVSALAALLRVAELPVETERGLAPAQVAYIREAECIGCTKCIQACPVDAILGAAKLMHTVLIDECTGCDLCVAPCPVDCIEMHPLITPSLKRVTPIVGGLARTSAERTARSLKRDHARQRFERRAARLQREQQARDSERRARQERLKTTPNPQPDAVQAAIARIRAHSQATASVSAPAQTADAAVKKAKIDVAMSKAQLNKALKAFGHPPPFEQYLKLKALQQACDSADARLKAALHSNDSENPA